MNLVHHENGHILQAREVGNMAFYKLIGSVSLDSARMNGIAGHNHNTFWTETCANYLSHNNFGSGYYAIHSRFPIQNISAFNLIRLRLASPFFSHEVYEEYLKNINLLCIYLGLSCL